MSGFAAFLGWRVIFEMAAGVMALLAVTSVILLPEQRPTGHIPYSTLLPSLYVLWRKEPILRLHSFLGAMGFAAFSCFWTALIFHFGRIFPHQASYTVGIMGLFGTAGALAAPLSGKLSDKLTAHVVNGVALLLVFSSFLIFWHAHSSLVLMAWGVIFLDAGVQGSHISNQTRIYALRADKRNRLTALYMTSYFIGGSIGSLVGVLRGSAVDGRRYVSAGACLRWRRLSGSIGVHPSPEVRPVFKRQRRIKNDSTVGSKDGSLGKGLGPRSGEAASPGIVRLAVWQGLYGPAYLSGLSLWGTTTGFLSRDRCPEVP